VFQRQFLQGGTALTGDVLVNTFVEGSQTLPTLFRTESGFFGTVWVGLGIDVGTSAEVEGVHARLCGYADISGWWIINGQATQVLQMDGVVVLINERGDASEAHFVGATQIVADGWGGLTANIVGDEIQFANASVWTRIPTLSQTAAINGTQAVLVQQLGIDLKFTNEHGDMSEGRFISSTEVVAENWGNLTGTIVGDDIHWANGSVWTATDLSAGVSVNLAGAWAIGGENTTILQFGDTLLFVNEHGGASAGVLIDSTHVVATGWGNLGGTIDVATQRIVWDNGSVWDRVPVLDQNENWHIDHHRPTAISQLGTRFLFTNENGARSEGRFDPAVGVVATDWGGLAGQIDFDDAHILWNNLSQWNNSQFGLEDEVFADANLWPWLV
jgi:hypothetical protein